jgi:hypothetical protein
MVLVMRPKIFIMLVGFGLSACTATPPVKDSVDEFRLLKISQGKMRKVDGEWVIYEETSDMTYEVNDRCMYAERQIDCLRHGFIIHYDSNGRDLQLSCIARTNMKVNAGNSAEEKYVDTNEDDFYMSLKGDERKFVNVQYVSGESGLSDLALETACKLNGKNVFEFNQRIRFQE